MPDAHLPVQEAIRRGSWSAYPWRSGNPGSYVLRADGDLCAALRGITAQADHRSLGGRNKNIHSIFQNKASRKHQRLVEPPDRFIPLLGTDYIEDLSPARTRLETKTKTLQNLIHAYLPDCCSGTSFHSPSHQPRGLLCPFDCSCPFHSGPVGYRPYRDRPCRSEREYRKLSQFRRTRRG